MSSGDADVQTRLEDIRDYIWNQDDGEEGSPKTVSDDRLRDFIIGKDHEESISEFDYELGEVDLPPESLNSLHTLVNTQISYHIGRLEANKVSTTPYGEGLGDRDYVKYIT